MKNYIFYEEEINQNQEKEITKDKINKPKELIEFNASPHFKENIIHSEKNCKELINENSYYCLTCKHSVCSICGIEEHKNHFLIQRKNCLNYDTSFFNEISKLIEDSFLIEKKKDGIKKCICDSIEKIKLNLDYLKENKMNEIDKLFNQIYFSLNEIKKFYLNARETIENYYSKNKNFFNIILNNENGNIDLENTIFLMNFEIMNLCDNKNLDVLENINLIKYKINNYNNLVVKKTENKINEIKYFLDEDINIEKFDDLYWDVKLRINKYNEHIFKFQKLISDVYKKSGNLEKVNDMLDIFDSKNKKGKEVIFNQEYFMNNVNNYNMKIKQKTRKNSKNKIHSPKRNMSHSRSKTNIYNINSINKEKECLTSRSNVNIISKNNNSSVNIFNTNNVIHIINIPPDEIMLDNRIIQKFFAYSIYGLYSKFFDTNDGNFNINDIDNNLNSNIPNPNFDLQNNNNYENYYNINFPNFNNLNYNNINNNKFNNNKIMNNYSNTNILNKPKTPNLKYNNNLIPNQFQKENLYSKTISTKNTNNKLSSILPNIKSEMTTLSHLKNWTIRNNKLKEYAKPISGTNYISIFNPLNKKITKIPISLNKEIHGYNIFPEGNRHILIDNILYITGGVDSIKNPINIVLSLNIQNFNIKKISNLNYPHSYHSIEYLDKYDCLIVIGGELNCICEIFDIYSEKWIKLPDLKIPRANVNLYFDNFTSDLYSLFGMEGKIEKKNNFSEVIEVLELKDIKSGWIKVDYYKSSDLNLTLNYITVAPFTKDKLLLYGGNIGRFEKKLFAIFDMIKNECVKIDNKIMDEIIFEEKKIKMVDLAIKEIN